MCGATCCCGTLPQDIKNEKKKIKRVVDKTKDVPSAELWKELARREAAEARHGAVPPRRHVVPRRGWGRVCGCSVVAIGGSIVCAPLCGVVVYCFFCFRCWLLPSRPWRWRRKRRQRLRRRPSLRRPKRKRRPRRAVRIGTPLTCVQSRGRGVCGGPARGVSGRGSAATARRGQLLETGPEVRRKPHNASRRDNVLRVGWRVACWRSLWQCRYELVAPHGGCHRGVHNMKFSLKSSCADATSHISGGRVAAAASVKKTVRPCSRM